MGRAWDKAIGCVCTAYRSSGPLRQQRNLRPGRRWIQVSPASGQSPAVDTYFPEPAATRDVESPDAKFEVLGAPYSLLSASLSASQPLYTRRGTLVGVCGKAENAISTLSLLGPVRRAALGIPFLYQKITSASPITALISTKAPITSFAVVHLNGTIDWMVTQRKALLAWTGHTLVISPKLNRQMSLAHWGNSQVTGRGLLALVGAGQVYQIVLNEGEEYTAHPSNVVAYTINQHPPLPYRFKSSVLRLQVPKLDIGSLLPDIKFFRVMRQSDTWKAIHNFLFTIRTWSRRTIWGDRLFLRFHGPVTILLQTRASRLSDALTSRDVNEIADSPAGVAQAAVRLALPKESEERMAAPKAPVPAATKPTRLSVATKGPDGKIHFESTSDFKSV